MADLTGKQIIQSFLDEYGLGALGDWAWNLFTSSGTPDVSSFVQGQLMVELPRQTAFQSRFPAYQQLIAEGRGISIEAYKQYESQIRDVASMYGMPEEMFADRDYVAKMLVGGVSAREFEQRAAINREAAYNVPAEVKQALTSMYGVPDPIGALTAYYMDPDRSLPIMQRQFQSAQIAGAALQQSIGVSTATAERLADQGVTFETAQQGFRQVSLGAGLMAAGGDNVTQDQLITAQFGDAASQQAVDRARNARKAAFQGGGGAVDSSSGISGLGSSSR